MNDPKITVRLAQSEFDPRKTAVFIRVESQVKPGLLSSTEIRPDEHGDAQGVMVAVGVACAAGAEHLCEHYGDNFDPDHCYVAGQKAFAEEIRLIAELNRDVPAKLRRLDSLKYGLSNGELELLGRWKHATERNQKLVRADLEAIDRITRRFHDAG